MNRRITTSETRMNFINLILREADLGFQFHLISKVDEALGIDLELATTEEFVIALEKYISMLEHNAGKRWEKLI